MHALGRVSDRLEPVGRDRLALAFQIERLDRSGVDGPAQERVRRLADQDLVRLGGLLQPGGDVDGVAGCEPFRRADDDLARVHADAAADAERRKRVAHLRCRADSPQRVVLMHRRHPEDGHHRVADELFHRAAVRLDDRLHPLEVPGEQRLQRLRVGALAERGRAHDVAEDHRDDLAVHVRIIADRSIGIEQLGSGTNTRPTGYSVAMLPDRRQSRASRARVVRGASGRAQGGRCLHGGGFAVSEKRLRLRERRLVPHRREQLARLTQRCLRM